MRVAENRAADRAGRAGPRLEAGAAVIDRPADQAVDRHRRRRRGRCRAPVRRMSPPRARMTSPRTPASATSTFEPPPSIVTGTPARARQRERRGELVARANVSSSQSAGPPTLNVVNGASGQFSPQRDRQTPRASRPRTPATSSTRPPRPPSGAVPARSTPPSPRRASTTANAIVSPGPSWPARPMSAVMTVAIFGYPPVVCRSAMSRIGWPDAGTCTTPSGVASEIMSAPRVCASGGPLSLNPMRFELGAIAVRRRLRARRARLRRSDRVCGPGRTRSVARPSGTLSRRPPTRAARPRSAPRCGAAATRQAIAGRERPAVKAAHRARQMRRAAAEHRRHIDAPGDGEVRARAADRRPNRSVAPAGTTKRPRRVDRSAIDGDLELRARNGHDPLVVEHQFGTDERDLQRRGVGCVAGHRVRDPMRDRVHRPGHGHAERLKAPSSAILDGRQQARLHHVHRRHVSAPLARAGRTRARSIASNRTASPAFIRNGFGARQVERLQRRPPDDLPAARRLGRIDRRSARRRSPTDPRGTRTRGVSRLGAAIRSSTMPRYASPGANPSMNTR